MTLKDQIAADAAIFFNTDEFGEAATYNGNPITVIPEIGMTGEKGVEITTDGQADRAYFWVRVSDVAAPQIGNRDKIVHNKKTWYVSRIAGTDNAMHRLECVANESIIPDSRRW